MSAQIAFDGEVCVDPHTDLVDLVFGQIADTLVGVEVGVAADPLSGGLADTEDVGERDLEPLLAGDVDAGNTCHDETLPQP